MGEHLTDLNISKVIGIVILASLFGAIGSAFYVFRENPVVRDLRVIIPLARAEAREMGGADYLAVEYTHALQLDVALALPDSSELYIESFYGRSLQAGGRFVGICAAGASASVNTYLGLQHWECDVGRLVTTGREGLADLVGSSDYSSTAASFLYWDGPLSEPPDLVFTSPSRLLRFGVHFTDGGAVAFCTALLGRPFPGMFGHPVVSKGPDSIGAVRLVSSGADCAIPDGADEVVVQFTVRE